MDDTNGRPAGEAPLVVGVGGTPRHGSTTETALRLALAGAEAEGAQTKLFGGAYLLRLGLFDPGVSDRTAEAQAFVEAVREADGLVVATPGYHGGVSGVVKNALDFLEDLRDDARPYLDGRAVGCLATASGWQGAGTTLGALRAIVHALRGWPTPLGATLNTAQRLFDETGACTDAQVAWQLPEIGRQVARFAAISRVPVPA